MRAFGEIIVVDQELYPEGSLERATPYSAGIDLRCAVDVTIHPGEVVQLDTGIRVWQGDQALVGFVLPRSSLGTKGLVLANTVGVIDADYQGPMLVQAWNRNPCGWWSPWGWGRTKNNSISLKRGDRICQLVFLPVVAMLFQQVEAFTRTTQRGAAGFGSTGK